MSQQTFPWIRFIIPVIVVLAVIAVAVNWWADSSRGHLPVLGEIPEFEMTERSGQPFGRKDLNGRINIVDFFFSSCPGVCPVMHGHKAELYHKLAGSDEVRLVSISVDPARDSLPALRAYAEKWDVTDDRWVFLRAPLEDVVWLCEEGFMLPADDLPMGHSTRFVLVDHLGRIRGYYDGMDAGSIKILLEHLRLLAGEMP